MSGTAKKVQKKADLVAKGGKVLSSLLGGHLAATLQYLLFQVYEFGSQGIGLPSGFWDVTLVTAVTASLLELSNVAKLGRVLGLRKMEQTW